MADLNFIPPNEENVRAMFEQAKDARQTYLIVLHDPESSSPYYCDTVSSEVELSAFKKQTVRECTRIVMEFDTRKNFDEQWQAERKSAMN